MSKKVEVRKIDFEFERCKEGQLNNIFENKKNYAKISTVLSELDLSFLTNTIEHKVKIFTKESLLNLYLFKRLKGIANHSELIRYLQNNKEEAFELGFFNDMNDQLALPAKRTLNEFLQNVSKETKNILELLIENILKAATKKRIVLDIELVRKTISKSRPEIMKNMRKATKLMKSLLYSNIDISIGKNAIFTKKGYFRCFSLHVSKKPFC